MALPEGTVSTALHPGWCGSCRTVIEPGQTIRKSDSLGWLHDACYPGFDGPMREALTVISRQIGLTYEQIEGLSWRVDELYERLQRLEDGAS